MWLIALAWLGLAHAGPRMIPEDSFAVVGRTAPTMRLDTLDGEAFDLAAYRGKPVVLAFWASWCGPCRAELPELSRLAAARDDVHVFAVNVDRERRLAERFMQQVDFDLPVVWDNESRAMGELDVTGMPTTFVIDARGTVKWRKTGFSQEKRLSELTAVLDGLAP
jgi:thiol-disulfide isomerase/thioredoxin